MDCYYSKMQTFRHFLFFNHRRKLGGLNFCRTLESLHSSKASNRDIYSLPYVLQTSSHNTNNNRRAGFRRVWIHTRGIRVMPATNSSGSNSTNASSSNGSDDDPGLYTPTRKKAGKCKTSWVCESCGDSFGQWWGACKSCGKVNSVKKFVNEDWSGGSFGGGAGTRAAVLSVGGYMPGNNFREHQASKGWVDNRPVTNDSEPQRLSDVTRGLDAKTWRIPLAGTFGIEVERVLGGGLVPGSLILVGGDPGVGKSTLLLQVSAILSEGCEVDKPAPVLYVSGEESVEQIGSRASRMKIDTEELFLYSSTDLEDILIKIHRLRPKAVVVDSIQTVYLKDASGSLGSMTQVKECATALLLCAKQTRIPIFLVGHMTKSGDIAGPRVLEHIVDVVLYLEGDRLLSHRILRAVKNRFGSTDEIGVLEMREGGLQAITNPSELYISQRNIDQDVLVGLALTVIIDGSRPFLIETQALCCAGRSSETLVMRSFNGVKEKRAHIIIAVLGKQAGINIYGNYIFLNVVGGVRVEETAADLAIAASLCSSFLEIPIPVNMAFIGEIGLGGELRTVARMDKRINELAKLGFTKCVIPTSSMKSLSGLEWEGVSFIYCKTVKEVINIIFPRNPSPFSTLMEVMMESEGEQKGVNVSGGVGEKQDGGGQNDVSMVAGEQKEMDVIAGAGWENTPLLSPLS